MWNLILTLIENAQKYFNPNPLGKSYWFRVYYKAKLKHIDFKLMFLHLWSVTISHWAQGYLAYCVYKTSLWIFMGLLAWIVLGHLAYFLRTFNLNCSNIFGLRCSWDFGLMCLQNIWFKVFIKAFTSGL